MTYLASLLYATMRSMLDFHNNKGILFSLLEPCTCLSFVLNMALVVSIGHLSYL